MNAAAVSLVVLASYGIDFRTDVHMGMVSAKASQGGTVGEVNLLFGFSTNDTRAVLRVLREVGWISREPPERLSLAYDEVTPGDDWFERILDSSDVTAVWPDRITRLVVHASGLVCGERTGVRFTAENVLGVLERVPFTVASFPSIHAWDEYDAPSFGRGHDQHGWGCAFRGEGHARLVSRRWLGTGPWRILRAPGDVTLVQFHDLAASSSTALEQARPGHRSMGIHDQGGFLQANYVFKTDLAALHSKRQRALIFVVSRRTLEPLELRDAAAARRLQPFGADKPIDDVVYVFIDEREANQQLPLLWRYGHQVRVIGADGVERRIDEGYQPALDKPAWVQALGRDDSRELVAS